MKKPELEKTLKDLGYNEDQLAEIVKAVEDELEPEEKPKEKDDDDEEIEKYKKENDVLKKSLEVARLQSSRNEDNRFEVLNDKLEKAISVIDDLKETNGELRTRIQEIEDQPAGMRSMRMQSVIEKSIGGEDIQDEDKRITLSVSKDRQLIEKAMDDIIEGLPEGTLRKGYEDSLMNLNSAGVAPSNEVAKDMFTKGVRLTK